MPYGRGSSTSKRMQKPGDWLSSHRVRIGSLRCLWRLVESALLRAIPETTHERGDAAANHQSNAQIARAVVELIGRRGDAKETEAHRRCHHTDSHQHSRQHPSSFLSHTVRR